MLNEKEFLEIVTCAMNGCSKERYTKEDIASGGHMFVKIKEDFEKNNISLKGCHPYNIDRDEEALIKEVEAWNLGNAPHCTTYQEAYAVIVHLLEYRLMWWNSELYHVLYISDIELPNAYRDKDKYGRAKMLRNMFFLDIAQGLDKWFKRKK